MSRRVKAPAIQVGDRVRDIAMTRWRWNGRQTIGTVVELHPRDEYSDIDRAMVRTDDGGSTMVPIRDLVHHGVQRELMIP